jgi:hypothetical protein
MRSITQVPYFKAYWTAAKRRRHKFEGAWKTHWKPNGGVASAIFE